MLGVGDFNISALFSLQFTYVRTIVLKNNYGASSNSTRDIRSFNSFIPLPPTYPLS